MTTAEEIEKAVAKLTPSELAHFRAWYDAFEAEQFDMAIARDAEAGRLDKFAEEALVEHRAGKSNDL